MTDQNAPTAKVRQRLFLLAVLLLGTGYLGHATWFNAHYIETDNAQIGADIAPISSRMSGFVTQILVRENQPVKTGDVLVTLDDRDAKARLAQAEAELKSVMTLTGQQGQAVSQLHSVSAQSQQSQAVMAQVRTEQEQAYREWERARSLWQQGLISQQAVDQAETLAKTSAARLQATRAGAAASLDQVNVSRRCKATFGPGQPRPSG